MKHSTKKSIEYLQKKETIPAHAPRTAGGSGFQDFQRIGR
jgi:hypothetical protein